jgi:methyl-accepting chemotaxis protein
VRWFANLRTGKKLVLGFGAMAVLIAMVGYQGVSGMSLIRGLMDEFYEKHTLGMMHVLKAEERLIAFSRSLSNMVLADEATDIDQRIRRNATFAADVRKNIEEYANRLVREDAKVRAGEMLRRFEGVVADTKALEQLARDNRDDDAQPELERLRASADEVEALMDELIEDKLAFMVKIKEESEGIYESRLQFILGLIAAALAIAAGVGFVIARMIARPLGRTAEVLAAVASRDLTPELGLDTRDEVGQMASSLDQALASLRAAMRSFGSNSDTLAASSEELTNVSQQLSASAEETSAQSGAVAAAAEQVSRNVQTVATATEEMSASIKEISKNASEAAQVASRAVQVADNTNQTVIRLGESSLEIGNVIKVITSIAEQTNLLALNATIEAARAGEAGKGFAVVANEVKELAKQTAEATEDIGRRIGAIQQDTQAAVSAIGEVTQIIGQISEISTTIAGAVEEQSATTAEIGRNVEEAHRGSSEIAENVTGVSQAAQSTASGATQTQAAAQELARMATALQSMVSQFKYESQTQLGAPPRSADRLAA